MSRALRWLVAIVCALAYAAPLLWLLAASFQDTADIFRSGLGGVFAAQGWTLGNYATAMRRAGLLRAAFVSLAQVSVIAGGGLVVNSMAAFAFARLEFRGRDLAFSAIVALIILPVEVLAIPLFFTARDLGLGGSGARALLGLSLPFVAKAFNIYFLRQQFLSLPTELEEAALLDGAGVWRQFWSVALPAIKPALATVVLLDLLIHWSDFLWPLLMSTRADTRTVQVALAGLFTAPPVDWGAILACAVLSTLPVLCAFRFFQRYVVLSDARVGIR